MRFSPEYLKEATAELSPAVTLYSRPPSNKEPPLIDKKQISFLHLKKVTEAKLKITAPISLTSVLCKLLEHIIHSHIMSHFDSHNIFTEAQHGFRKCGSTETQLLLTIHDLAHTLEEDGQMDCVLLDISKASDKVPHQRLLSKLHYYGVWGHTLEWIKSFLHNCTQLVNGKSSKQVPVLSGVPQGTVLGRLVFLSYTNDMPAFVTSNIKLYCRISSGEDSVRLQEDLDKLQEWEKTWLMSFHPEKCEVL